MVEYVAVYVCLYVEHRPSTPSSTVGVRGWLLQALSFVNRVEVASTTKPKKSTKLVARKPNDNQKRTKYSKSNLAWIYLNKPECEVLENNKRFMKDLKRYYRDINDLIKDLRGT